jgi:hypothetical protein
MNDALISRYDFIRKFARYDSEDYPILVLKPKFKWIPFSVPDIESPCLRFTEYNDDLDKRFGVYEYMIMGHNFVIPTSEQYKLHYEDYLIHLDKSNHPFGTELISIDRLEDLDFSFFFIQEGQ